MKIVEMELGELIPYENNPRLNDEAVEGVKNSIKEFGFKVPIIIDKNNVIVAGHTRYKASIQLGLEKVPCIIADDLTDEQIKAFRIADNKVSEKAEWDLDLLQMELEGITDIDMSGFGFDFDLEDDEVEVEEIEAPEVPEEAKSKLGEIYKLGNHILMCGDSTSEEDVARLTNGELMDLVVTDPPYNVNYAEINRIKIKRWKEHYAGANTKEIINDSMDDENFVSFLSNSFYNLINSLKEGGAFYIWHSVTKTKQFLEAMDLNNMQLHQILIWNKSSITLGMSDYQWKHEPCIYGWKEGASHYFINDRTQKSVLELEPQDIEKMKKDDLIKLVKQIYELPTTVIDCHKPLKNDLHPTMKPIKLCAKLIQNSTRKGEKVLDLFGGSGSTLMACEQLGRTCYMMEYDPKYVDVIIERWEAFTGKKAERMS